MMVRRCLASILAGCVADLAVAAGPPVAPSLVLEPYVFTARSGETVEAERGTLTVPYDRARPEAGTIDLRFVRFPAMDDVHATTAARGATVTPPPPLVYLAGGPGGSGIAAARGSRFELFMKLRVLGDVIAWDQRGTGASEPQVRLAATVDVPYQGAVSAEWLRGAYADAAAAARAGLERDGFDPAPLNTNASADDLDDLRRALGAETLRLWAISYGTHLALATANRHPEAIDSMVLAGVEGLDATYKLPSQTDAPLAALSREVASHPIYAELIPDFSRLMREVLERADREPFAVEIEDPATGETVTTLFGRLDLEMATWRTLFRRDRIAGLPAAYLALAEGRVEILERVVDVTRGPGSAANVMSIAMDCASGVSPERLARIERETPGSLLGRSMNFRSRAVCDALGIPDLGEAFRAPVRSDMPVLCLSGELDVRTPPANADAVLAGFPNGHHVIITRAAHDNDLWISSPRIAECILTFFRGEAIPTTRIELSPIEFTVPSSPDGGGG